MTPVGNALAFLAVLGSPQDKERAIQVHGAVENHVIHCNAANEPVTVLEAITSARVVAGADLASTVVIRRSGQPSPVILRINVRHMIRTGDMTRNVVLAAGDILFVPRLDEPQASTTAETASGTETDSPLPIFDLLEALLETKPDAGTVVSVHLHFATKHAEIDVRRAHILVLGTLGRPAAAAVPALADLARQHDKVAEDAITALGMIGPVAKDAIPTLEGLSKHKEARLRERAKAALRAIRPHDLR